MLRSKHVLSLSDLPCLLIVPCISPCITYLTVILFVYLIPFLLLFSLSSLSFLLRVCIPASFTSHSFAPWKLSINLPTFLISSLLPRTQAWYEGDFDSSSHHGLDVGLCLLGHREGVCRLPVYLCLIKFLPRGLHISRPLCTEFWGKQIWHYKKNTNIPLIIQVSSWCDANSWKELVLNRPGSWNFISFVQHLSTSTNMSMTHYMIRT